MKNKNEKMNSLRQGSNQGPSNPLATALRHGADDEKMKKKQKLFTTTVFAGRVNNWQRYLAGREFCKN